MSTFSGLLVRLPSMPFAAAAGLAGAVFELKPLFFAGRRSPGLGLSAANDRHWYLAQPKESVVGANPWDLAHEAVSQLAGGATLAGGGQT